LNLRTFRSITQGPRDRCRGILSASNIAKPERLFGLSQTIAGTKIAPAFRWAAYGSWPYAALYIKP
jgi:hypothetical protein